MIMDVRTVQNVKTANCERNNMGFFKNFYNDIDASNPTERIHTFIWGLFGISLMMFAIADLIGGGIYILCILIGVIR